MKRRELIAELGLAVVVIPVMGQASQSEQGSEPMVLGSDSETELLFVQNSASVSLKNGKLSLENVGTSTLYFSDRPERLVGHWETADFISNWDTGGDQSFATDPPNAALSIMSSSEPENIVVLLKSPRMEGADLLYDVEVLEGSDTIKGENIALFIDTFGRPLSPVSVAGVHRRHRRRRRRRIIRR